jgi:hypothetical protein
MSRELKPETKRKFEIDIEISRRKGDIQGTGMGLVETYNVH